MPSEFRHQSNVLKGQTVQSYASELQYTVWAAVFVTGGLFYDAC